jgi:multiple sugar transport system ATP-binding protein
MAKVTLKNIKKVYDKNIVAVQEFNLDIADKEFIVLVGPSGCGKSTTLRMVAGLEEISEGELYIGDRVVNDVAPKDRDIAMVFQNYALYPHMTVYENMAFALKLRRVKKQEIDAKVKEAAEILGITELLQRKPKALSGGQRQRVAIGRAIVREPKVFLMDEPLSNLDAKLRNQMRAEIIKLRQSVNTTFIYVTHDQTEAMTLGDRIVIMKDGFIQQIGTPQQVFNHPMNLFVAGFIGTPQMNFFDAKLEKSGSGYSVSLYGVRLALPVDISTKLAARGIHDQTITLGVRPEHMNLALHDAPGAISAKVDVSEMMGSEFHLHVNVGERDAVIRVPAMELPEPYRRGIGSCAEIHFNFPVELSHLFSKETEMNLLV